MYYVCMEETAFNAETINFVPAKIEEPKEEGEGGFKILEILVVISAFVVMGLLALLAINPSKEAAEARNIKRTADISAILSFVSSYNNISGEIPEEIPIDKACVNFGNEICKTGPYDCSDLVNMAFLAQKGSEELIVMPQDPLYISMNGTGYYVSRSNEGQVTVCAPHAERNEKISFSKLMY